MVPLLSPTLSSNSFPFHSCPSRSPSLWHTSILLLRLSNDRQLFILLSHFTSSLFIIALTSLSLSCSPSLCLDHLTCVLIHSPALSLPLHHFCFVDLNLDHVMWRLSILVGSFSHNCSSSDLGSWLYRVFSESLLGLSQPLRLYI